MNLRKKVFDTEQIKVFSSNINRAFISTTIQLENMLKTNIYNIFYIEIYYNDFLKYNQTLEKFKDILDRSKYSNINNYCKNFNYYKSNKYESKRIGIKVILIAIIIAGFIAIISEYLIFASEKKKYLSLKKIKNFKNEYAISKDKINDFHDLVFV